MDVDRQVPEDHARGYADGSNRRKCFPTRGRRSFACGEMVAPSAPRVLITGASGTGKEMAAQLMGTKGLERRGMRSARCRREPRLSCCACSKTASSAVWAATCNQSVPRCCPQGVLIKSRQSYNFGLRKKGAGIDGFNLRLRHLALGTGLLLFEVWL